MTANKFVKFIKQVDTPLIGISFHVNFLFGFDLEVQLLFFWQRYLFVLASS